MEQNIKDKLISTGVNPKTVEESLKNAQRLQLWNQVVDLSKIALPCDKKFGNLFYDLVTKLVPKAQEHVELLSKMIASEEIKK